MILEVLNLVICAIAIKFRSASSVIVWIEAARNIANAFVPHNYNAFSAHYSNYQMLRTYTNSATNLKVDMFVVGISETFI